VEGDGDDDEEEVDITMVLMMMLEMVIRSMASTITELSIIVITKNHTIIP